MPADAPEPFDIAVHDEENGTRRLRVVGELDLASAPQLRAEARRQARAARELVLDLRDVTFMDSTGLATLVGLDEESRNDGFGLAVLAGDPVRKVIELCSLEKILPLR
jgi:anti-anti-sigma factor